MGKWDAMKAAYDAAPEGTAVVLWRMDECSSWQKLEKPAWIHDEEYRLLLNVTEWQPPAPLYQARVEIPRPLTTLEGRETAWLVSFLNRAEQVITGDWGEETLQKWLENGLLYATEDDANARRAAMLRVEEA